MTTYFFDGQTVVNWLKGSWRTMNNCSCVTRFPPQLMLLKQLISEITNCLTLDSLGQLFIPAKNDNACPFLKVFYVINFNASEGIGP